MRQVLMIKGLSWLVILLGLLSGGCIAGIRAGEVDSNNNPRPEGVRYFHPAPYFIIEEIGNRRWNAQIQNVIDREHEYYVQPYVYLGSGKATVLFNDDGTLKSFKLATDTTAIPSEVITATKDITLKREELKREEIEAKRAKASAAFQAGQEIARQDSESRTVFAYRIKGNELIPIQIKGNELIPIQSGKGEVAKIEFEKPAPPPMPPIPMALSPGLDIIREENDPKHMIAIGIKGIELTTENAGTWLRFFVDEEGRREVSKARKDAIIASAKFESGRLVFKREQLWDISAIGKGK